MKVILMASLVMMSLNAFAVAEKFVCQEYDRKTEKYLQRSVVLTPTGEAVEAKDRQGRYTHMEIPYHVAMFNGPDWSSEVNVKGVVATEDVNFNFSSSDGKVEVYLYLDEMNESGMSYMKDGKKVELDLYCR